MAVVLAGEVAVVAEEEEDQEEEEGITVKFSTESISQIRLDIIRAQSSINYPSK